jgi:hypothetical protein
MTHLLLSTLGLAAVAAFAAAGGSTPVDSSRPDCPGQIVCPQTGELVCRDRCPLGDAAAEEAAVPDCCRR